MGFPYCSDQSISHSLEHSSEKVSTEKEIFLPNREGIDTWVQVGHKKGWLTQDYLFNKVVGHFPTYSSIFNYEAVGFIPRQKRKNESLN